MDLSSFFTLSNASIELARLMVNERDRHKLAAIQIDFTEKVIQLQTKLSEVSSAIVEKDGRISHLADRVRELERRQSEEARYQLAKVGTVGDFFAYKLRPAAELVERTDEPEHFLCQPCFDAGKKSVLRIIGSWCQCSICGTKTTITPSEVSSKVVAVTTARARDW